MQNVLFTRSLPSIFADDDNVYNTYALPSENPRHQVREQKTGANTPRAIALQARKAA